MDSHNATVLTRPARASAARAPLLAEMAGLAGFAALLTIYEIAAVLNGSATTWIMGRLGTEALAAGGMVGSVMLLVFLAAQGLIQGIAIVFAQAVGAGQHDFARATAVSGIHGAAIAALPVMAAVFLLPAAFALLPGDEAVHRLAGQYVIAALPGMLATFILLTQRALVFALQASASIVVVTWVGLGVNVAVAFALGTGAFGLPRLGMTGLGLASSASAWLQLAVQSLLIARRPELRRYFAGVLRPSLARLWPVLRTCVGIGLPIAAVMFIEGFLITGSYFLMTGHGTLQLAAHALAQQWMAIVFMAPIGISQAVMFRTGRLIGEGDGEGCARTARASVLLTLAVTLAVGTTFVLFGPELARMLAGARPGGSAQLVETTAAFLRIVAVTQVLRGLVVVLASILRGCGDTRVALGAVVLGYWVIGLGTALLCGSILGLGGQGVWLGLSAGFAVAAASLFLKVRITIAQIHHTIQQVEARHAQLGAIGT